MGEEVPEDEEEDHCYFNKKVEPAPTPPPPPPPSAHQTPRKVFSKRGRPKQVKSFGASRDKEKLDRYNAVNDRRERRRLKRQDKEREERVKRLKKLTCARSRSIYEHQEMKHLARGMGTGADRERWQQERRSYVSTVARQTSRYDDIDAADIGVTDDRATGVLGAYPYVDHSYFKTDHIPVAAGLPASVVASRCGTSWWRYDPKDRQRPITSTAGADVSAFQECETMLLGLGSGDTIKLGSGYRRHSRQDAAMAVASNGGAGFLLQEQQPQPMNHAASSGSSSVVAEFRNSFIQQHRAARFAAGTTADEDTSLTNLGDSDIPDLDEMAETELLKAESDYSILQDILGTCIQPSSSSGHTRRHSLPGGAYQTGNKVVSSGDLVSLKRSTSTSVGGGNAAVDDGSFNDGIPLVENQMEGEPTIGTDLDDIELCEADYNLWQGDVSPAKSSVEVSSSTFASGTPGGRLSSAVFRPSWNSPRKGFGQFVSASAYLSRSPRMQSLIRTNADGHGYFASSMRTSTPTSSTSYLATATIVHSQTSTPPSDAGVIGYDVGNGQRHIGGPVVAPATSTLANNVSWNCLVSAAEWMQTSSRLDKVSECDTATDGNADDAVSVASSTTLSAVDQNESHAEDPLLGDETVEDAPVDGLPSVSEEAVTPMDADDASPTDNCIDHFALSSAPMEHVELVDTAPMTCEASEAADDVTPTSIEVSSDPDVGHTIATASNMDAS